jgi:hypothetical protein
LTEQGAFPYTVSMEQVFAQTPVDIGTAFSANGPNFTSIGSLVSVVVQNAFMLAGVIAFVLLVLGGFGMIAGAGGDPKNLEKSKQAITGAVIGLIVIIGSFWIIQLIQTLTGITLLPGIK